MPLFHVTCADLFSYLDDKWQIIYSQDLLAQLNLNWQEITKRYEYYNYQYPCLKPTDLFLSSDKIFAALKAHTVWEIAIEGEYYQGFKELPELAANSSSDTSLLD